MYSSLKTILFSGGGVKGFAYAGLLRALREKHNIDWGQGCPQLTEVIGCSVGSMLALMICLGYSASEISDKALKTNLASLVNLSPLSILTEQKLGLDDGEIVRGFITDLCEKRGVSRQTTFRQLRGPKLTVVTTNIHTKTPFYFNRDTSPDVLVIEAIYASIAIPPLFAPIKINGIYYADGALINNYPIDAFPSAHGFVLKSEEKNLDEELSDAKIPFVAYVARVARILASVAREHPWERTTIINCQTAPTIDFSFDGSQLFKIGYDAV